MSIRISQQTASYNLLDPSERQTQIIVYLPEGKAISAMWPEGDAPEIDGLSPVEVVDLITERIKRVWTTDREGKERKLATAAWVAEHAVEINREWAQGEIERRRRRMTELEHEIAYYTNTYVEATA